jgi:hypothetical protein
MATEKVIKEHIERTVRGGYKGWTIGVTNYPEQRKVVIGNPAGWLAWKADCPQTANRVHRYFLQKGFEVSLGGPLCADYVFIF